ncbi:MAG TPA: DUF1631 family protein [Burkholderiaceae bacterium]|nr:DUF1631 family protein [Burkholderiaceae bacterium]
MQISQRVIHLAKERALSGFSMLVRNMVEEAADTLRQADARLSSAEGQKTLSAAWHFLHLEGNQFQQRIVTYFRDYLDRAMQTMYTDLRAGLRDISADRLSLIDDETITRQMEVDRLVLQIRDASQENLGRLNLIIAQLHGEHDVRERENPFRPYLLARSLHEALRDMVQYEGLSRILFDHLSNAMANRAPGYFAAVREIFESSGIHAQLLARPSRLSKGQRDLLAQQAAQRSRNTGAASDDFPFIGTAPPRNFESRILPGLKHMQDLLQHVQSESSSNLDTFGSKSGGQSAAFQDFVWQIFNQPRPAGLPRKPPPRNLGAPDQSQDAAASSLLGQLMHYQKQIASGQAQGGIFVARDRLDASVATGQERIMIDVVALLFEFILQDAQIPEALREQIGRLEIPFLKAAILAPELMHQATHPARQLLNRIGTAAVGLHPDAQPDQAIATEIKRIATKIIDTFDRDMTIFSDAAEDFEQFLTETLPAADSVTKRCVVAIDQAEASSALCSNTASALQGLLSPLPVDPSVSDFIMRIWLRVLVHPFNRQSDTGAAAGELDAIARQYLDVLPELVWSVQEKRTPQERNALIRLLPGLVRQIKAGLESIQLPERETRQALDQLVALHTNVLRAAATSEGQALLGLEDMRQHFSLLVINQDSAFWMEDGPVSIDRAAIEEALSRQHVVAEVMASSETTPAPTSDAEWLMQLEKGACAEYWSGNTCKMMRLVWITRHKSLYLFKSDDANDPAPVIYSSVSLIEALRDGVVRPVEYAPLFDRAVESLLDGAESL